jgi:Uma2 family endonuclease
MTVTAEVLGDRGDPWTEEDYLALGETRDRVELIDGSLIVSPAPTPWHQETSRFLANVLDSAAKQVGLKVYEAVNIRLRQGRIPIPDLVIVDRVDPHELVIDVTKVKLVCEIVSPSSEAGDRMLKIHLYGDDRIPWYLLVDPDPKSLTLTLFHHNRRHYVEYASGRPGAPLVITEPVAAVIDPASLLPRA